MLTKHVHDNCVAFLCSNVPGQNKWLSMGHTAKGISADFKKDNIKGNKITYFNQSGFVFGSFLIFIKFAHLCWIRSGHGVQDTFVDSRFHSCLTFRDVFDNVCIRYSTHKQKILEAWISDVQGMEIQYPKQRSDIEGIEIRYSRRRD